MPIKHKTKIKEKEINNLFHFCWFKRNDKYYDIECIECIICIMRQMTEILALAHNSHPLSTN